MRQDWLKKVASEHNWTYGVEVGVYSAKHMEKMLAANSQLYLIGVDLWEPYNEIGPHGTFVEHSDMETKRQQAESRLRPFNGRYDLWQMDSRDAANEIEDHSLDFVMIDADHRYENVKADIEAWKPKVRPGGMLVGDDLYWAEVVQAACDALGDFCVSERAWYVWL